jgi:hypothetical protein
VIIEKFIAKRFWQDTGQIAAFWLISSGDAGKRLRKV